MNRFPLFPLLALTASAFAGYDDIVNADHPIEHWTANPALTTPMLRGGAEMVAGPRAPQFPQFTSDNHGVGFHQPGASLRIADKDGRFTFKKGDTISIESWVKCDALGNGQNAYVIGKGRTGRAGQPPHNQNWGLRLREGEGAARPSFVFRDERNATDGNAEFWHRWTAASGFLPGAGWHHVAVTYTFGKPESIHGWLDGAELKGEWDMGGATDLGPWADNDEVWIGTSMGGAAGASLRGAVDAVAVYRTALTTKGIAARWQNAKVVARKSEPLPPLKLSELPANAVRLEVFEHRVADSEAAAGDWTVNDSDKKLPSIDVSWSDLPPVKTDSWTEPAFALSELVAKYSPRGVRRDRTNPFLVRLAGAVTLPAGEHHLLIRAIRGGRLSIDGKIVATSEFYPKAAGPERASDAEAVADQLEVQLVKEAALLQPGHSEAAATFVSDGKPHLFAFELFVGGKSLRPELGRPSVSVSSNGSPYRLLTADTKWFDFTDDGWKQFSREQRAHVAAISATRRANADELAYWKSRHDLARAEIAKQPPIAIPEIQDPKSEIRNPIDAFIAEKLIKAGAKPAPTIADAAFLRRLTLDTIGLGPTPDELTAFLADPSKNKRSRAIERLLADPRWADEWVPYWQDVLAENPAILKATLNNSGPFRFFLADALRDNWPMDRFITALVGMEGSGRNGGSAGFAIASQNDLPMANKAQILSSAFLAMEMKCARCHDAPNHPFNQEDLFAISAMLQREPVTVPASSLTKGLNVNSHVVVSLTPGQKIDAHFPFASLKTDPLPGVLRNSDDSREQLAAIMTDPRNERSAQVIVNRLWKRLLGFGIVDPVDDWENVSPSHPELLAWLGRELISHDYDLKHVARLIFESSTYQGIVTERGAKFAKAGERLFESPARRRLTAEQIVDSLFAVAGKDFDCEDLNFDLDGRRTAKDFLSLGNPQRAWEFVGLSNERDRPSLGKPAAQPFTDVLTNFGWRDSRAEPKSVRDEAANVLQPAILANGILGERITRLSDDSAFTSLALRDQPLDDLITAVFQRVLSRAPSEKERAAFTEELREGYADRVRVVSSSELPKKPRVTKFAMWSNHLHPDSTPVVYERERLVRAGDPATPRLAAPWRERLEDAIWALIISPEFTYVP